jgi:hypothetical protein
MLKKNVVSFGEEEGLWIVVTEDRNGDDGTRTSSYLAFPGMLLSPLGLITYVYPLLQRGYDSAVYILNDLMNNYRSKNEVIKKEKPWAGLEPAISVIPRQGSS